MTDERGEPEERPGPWTEVSHYSSYGLSWALATLLFALLGLWLDRRLGTLPWLLIAGALVGGGAGFYRLYYHLVLEPRHRGEEREG